MMGLEVNAEKPKYVFTSREKVKKQLQDNMYIINLLKSWKRWNIWSECLNGPG
jgi:hypothetical protein